MSNPDSDRSKRRSPAADSAELRQRLLEARRNIECRRTALMYVLDELDGGEEHLKAHHCALYGSEIIGAASRAAELLGFVRQCPLSDLVWEADVAAALKKGLLCECTTKAHKRPIMLIPVNVGVGAAQVELLVVSLAVSGGPDQDPIEDARRTAHDFNNVLTTIVGYAELGGMVSQDVRLTNYFGEIHDSGKRGQNIVKALQSRLAGYRDAGSSESAKK